MVKSREIFVKFHILNKLLEICFIGPNDDFFLDKFLTIFTSKQFPDKKIHKKLLVMNRDQTGSNQDFKIKQFGVKYQVLFFQTEQTVNRKKSGFRTAPFKESKSITFNTFTCR